MTIASNNSFNISSQKSKFKNQSVALRSLYKAGGMEEEKNRSKTSVPVYYRLFNSAVHMPCKFREQSHIQQYPKLLTIIGTLATIDAVVLGILAKFGDLLSATLLQHIAASAKGYPPPLIYLIFYFNFFTEYLISALVFTQIKGKSDHWKAYNNRLSK